MTKIFIGILFGFAIWHFIHIGFLKWQKREIELMYGLCKGRQVRCCPSKQGKRVEAMSLIIA